jgi:cell wall-associated NlpC family hydrolase
VSTLAQRLKLRDSMQWMLAHEPGIHYSMAHHGELLRIGEAEMRHRIYEGVGVYDDCSGTATALFKWAGLKDPSGLDYAWAGTSESMLEHLPHYTNPSGAKIGALVHFENPNHVSIVLKPGWQLGAPNDPLLFSFGSEHGPRRYRLSEERQWHPGAVVFLDISKL